MANPDTLAQKRMQWRKASEVASHENFLGLGDMMLSCYYYEEMLIKESEKGCDFDLFRCSALLRAWICVFFEILRVMTSKEYKNNKCLLLEGKIRKLEEIKNNVSDVRTRLSKLKENKSRQKGVDKKLQKIQLDISPFNLYAIEFNVPVGILMKTVKEFDIKEESEKFLSIILKEE